MNHRQKIAVLATAVLGAAILIPVSLGADPTDVTVTGGALSITNPAAGNFTGVTLDGTAQTTTASLATFEANDSRGTGAGWNVTVQGSQFAEHNGTSYVESGKTLPTSSLTMPAPTVTADGTSSDAPSIQSGAPWAIDVGSAVKIASAAADTGMGKYDFGAVTLSLGVPASAYAKTYRSDVTVSAVSGP
jgi:hypothetical protein